MVTCFRDRWTNSAHTCVACHAPCARFKTVGWTLRYSSLSSYLFLLPPNSFFLFFLILVAPTSPPPPPSFPPPAPNNSKRYRTKIGLQNYATRGSGISSSADLAPAVSLVLMTSHPSLSRQLRARSPFDPPL